MLCYLIASVISFYPKLLQHASNKHLHACLDDALTRRGSAHHHLFFHGWVAHHPPLEERHNIIIVTVITVSIAFLVKYVRNRNCRLDRFGAKKVRVVSTKEDWY